MAAVTKKANNTVSFLQRNLSTCPKDVKATCYKTLVRPLEYGSSVWDPLTKSKINKLEAFYSSQHDFVTVTIEHKQCNSYYARLRLGTTTDPSPTDQDRHAIRFDIWAASLLSPIGHANRFLVTYCSIYA